MKGNDSNERVGYESYNKLIDKNYFLSNDVKVM